MNLHVWPLLEIKLTSTWLIFTFIPRWLILELMGNTKNSSSSLLHVYLALVTGKHRHSLVYYVHRCRTPPNWIIILLRCLQEYGVCHRTILLATQQSVMVLTTVACGVFAGNIQVKGDFQMMHMYDSRFSTSLNPSWMVYLRFLNSFNIPRRYPNKMSKLWWNSLALSIFCHFLVSADSLFYTIN